MSQPLCRPCFYWNALSTGLNKTDVHSEIIDISYISEITVGQIFMTRTRYIRRKNPVSLVPLKSFDHCTGHNRCQHVVPEAAYGPLTMIILMVGLVNPWRCKRSWRIFQELFIFQLFFCLKTVHCLIVDCPTQLIHIGISICFKYMSTYKYKRRSSAIR